MLKQLDHYEAKGQLKWFFLLLLAVIWGSSFILMKRGLTGFPPEQVAAIRISVAALASLPFFLSKMKSLKPEKLPYIAVVGIIGSGIPAFLFSTAQQRIPSYQAGMLNSLTPVFTLLVGSLFFRNRFSNRQVWGVLLGFAGAVGIIFFRDHAGHGMSTEHLGALLIVLATLCYGISVNTIKSFLSDTDTLLISSCSLLMAGLPYSMYLVSSDFSQRLIHLPEAQSAIMNLVVLAVFGTALSNLLYFRLVKMGGPLFASSVTYLMPVFALGWGLADGESLHPFHLPALVAILAGVGLISSRTKTA
jgi:drug/metabolite transporter (DMT)-like permease